MRIIFIVLMVCASCFVTRGQQRVIKGEIGQIKANMMYLYDVENEYRGVHQQIDSAGVEDGHFVFTLEDKAPALYFVGDSPYHGGYFFLDGQEIVLKPETVTEENIVWTVTGSPLDQVYREFNQRVYAETFGRVKDSLNALFCKAREREDRAEMMRIKNESEPYYDEGYKKERALVNEYIQKNRENPFGMYLYYFRVFQHRDFQTVEDITSEKKYVNGFGVKSSPYIPRIMERLGQYEKCAIGHEAPEIVGQDTLGNPLCLSDLRGYYVIVDFWDSYCHWCREETPALKRALEHFKDKKFRILGVSSDREKKRWMDAIHEDGSYWDHLILNRGDDVMDRYCIQGIPHIILIGPDGKILAKELRGEDLIKVPEKFVK